jgi:ribonucleoside-diphosphate reductase alpha chain
MPYKYNDALKASKTYFGGEDLPARVFLDKYALRNTDNELLECVPTQMHERIAKEFHRIEKIKFKNPMSYEEILGYINDFGSIIPQGGPMFGIGNKYQFATLSNCYVLDTPEDSYGGILHTDQQLVQIAKRRGGNGLDLSNLRPVQSATKNSSRTSTGIVPFAKRYSNSTREVGQGGRRGALMITLSVHHPQILDFVTMKHDLTQVTGANISVKLSDEFLEALENNEDFELRWPVSKEKGDGEEGYYYDGQYNDKPKISIKTSAAKVWDAIIHSAWLTAEPGILFWDSILKESPADCYASLGFRTVSTNPCGEIPLCVLDSCRLLVVNLLKCVRNPFTKDAYFDYELLYKLAQVAQRFMDNIIDLELECIDRIIKKINNDPEPDYIKAPELATWKRIREKCKKGRRTGTGITALADAMAAVNVKYGSEESVVFTDKVYQTLKLGCYRSSVDMAKELGPFPIWDKALEKHNPFLLRIKSEDAELYADMQKYGRRNIALLTTAPTGSTSLVTQVFKDKEIRLYGTSSGIEPCYKMLHKRRKKINPSEENIGSIQVAFTDENGDKWEEFIVYHPAIKYWMKVTGAEDATESPYAGACAEDIDWTMRVKIQAAAQRHIDHSISSTVNLPNNVTVDEVKKIYVAAWKAGCKGMTVYRDGCRSGILVEAKQNESIKKNDAVKRPRKLFCELHKISVSHKRYMIIVGLMNREPYEVFVLPMDKLDKETFIESGFLHKVKRGHYSLVSDKGNIIYDNVADYCSDEQESLARLTSASLRHGVRVNFVVEQLERTKGNILSFSKAVARALKKYIPDGTKVTGDECPSCKSDNLVRSEGCKICKDCSWSACS